MITWDEVKTEFTNTLNAHRDALLYSENPDEVLENLLEAAVMFDNHSLAALLLNNLSLGYPKETELIYSMSDVFEVIRDSIQQSLEYIAGDWLKNERHQASLEAEASI